MSSRNKRGIMGCHPHDNRGCRVSHISYWSEHDLWLTVNGGKWFQNTWEHDSNVGRCHLCFSNNAFLIVDITSSITNESEMCVCVCVWLFSSKRLIKHSPEASAKLPQTNQRGSCNCVITSDQLLKIWRRLVIAVTLRQKNDAGRKWIGPEQEVRWPQQTQTQIRSEVWLKWRKSYARKKRDGERWLRREETEIKRTDSSVDDINKSGVQSPWKLKVRSFNSAGTHLVSWWRCLNFISGLQ